MVQYKKDNIRDNIDSAALTVFAQKGYKAAKVSDISLKSGVSVGNIYRYYKNKDEIFYTLVPEEFPNQILEAIKEKISAAKGAIDVSSNAFIKTAEAFARLMLSERERIIILFSGSVGSKYEHFKPSFASAMLSMLRSIYEEQYAAHIKRYGGDEMLCLIYENLINAYAQILMRHSSEEETVNNIRQFNLYHFTGITRLLDLQEDK